MSKKKIILAVIVLAIVVSIVGGMLAYFTNTSNTLTNTFTVGDSVTITLKEPNWNSAYAQGLSFGDTVAKDPTVTNTGSHNAYVFLKVDVPTYYKYIGDTATKTEMFTYTPDSNWYELTSLRTTNANSVTHIYAYGTSSAMTALAPNGTATLFNSVTFLNNFTYASNYNVVATITPPASETNDDPALVPASSNIVVTGYAIQTNGLRQGNTSTAATSPADVYGCLFGELGTAAGLINPGA